MGGGDLNLKKSWHPSTMKNMEKVWKAEQQDSQEKKRIAELKREIEMEKDKEDMTKYAMDQGVIEKKDDKKLDWMYKGPNQAVNREDYLLGKAIDKPFEQMAQAEKDVELNRAPKNHVEHECIPPSLRFFSGTEQVDLARKLQEDPLYAIKKKEMETKSQLLRNPVRLKQLRDLLEQQSKKSKSVKRSNKKHKKKKRSESTSDDESDSDGDLDNLLAKKYKKLKGEIDEAYLIRSMKKLKKAEKKKRASRKRRDGSSSSGSSSDDSSSDSDSDESEKKEKKRRANRGIISGGDDRETRRKECKKKHKSSNERRVSDEGSKSSKRKDRKKRKSSDEDETNEREREISRKRRKHGKREGRRSVERSNGDNGSIQWSGKRETTARGRTNGSGKDGRESDRDERIEDTGKVDYGLMKADRTRVEAPSRPISERPSSAGRPKSSKHEEKRRWVQPKKQRSLTEDEKEQRRREMMANASVRDRERERNVKRYRDQEKKEQIDKTYNKDFLRKQLAAAAEIGTVESRIRSNINNIQRSGRAMDTNFAKR